MGSAEVLGRWSTHQLGSGHRTRIRGSKLDTDNILQTVKSLYRLRRSCSYYQVDLHVHSPHSSDYDGDATVSAQDFVAGFVAKGFDLIAITDHNTGTYVDSAISARDRIVEEGGGSVVILPGVELYVSPGIHLLAILPDGGSAAISDLLSRLGLPVDQHGDTTRLISQPIEEIARVVRDRKGILIRSYPLTARTDSATLSAWNGT